ncbi:hypothetical protein OS493_027823 [Desmophyllum pertusum]|uniref:Uncharacterized protein n=1 Tax=Desmophyllum pertusum TaxID=174260 RepID=A0A9W9YXB1_9CNID|nr:hypothetical protein OS493_027823 [Desmophyllum pertusum]
MSPLKRHREIHPPHLQDQSLNVSAERKVRSPLGTFFGDDNDLPDTETRSDSPSRNSRFSELLGKKEKDEPKKQVPKSLDDFMANISGKPLQEVQQARKCPALHPTSRSSLEAICLLQPPAANHVAEGVWPDQTQLPARPKRSVRFSDDLGLGDELFGSERPSYSSE